MSNWLNEIARRRFWRRCLTAALIGLALPWYVEIWAQASGKLSAATAGPPRKYAFLSQTSGEEDLSSSTGKSKSVAVVRGQILVRFRPGVEQVRQQSILGPWATHMTYFATPAKAAPLIQQQKSVAGSSLFEQLALVTLEEKVDLDQALQHFRKNSAVLYAEPNYRLQITGDPGPAVTPNDFNFPQQWSLQNVGQGDGMPGADIRAPLAWQYGTGDRRVVVAVLDTGVDYFHPDLVDNVWVNPKETPGNGLDDDTNGFVDDLHGYDFVNDDSDPWDDHGHGTHVSGIIGAVGNNRIGMAGVCWQVSLMALKVFDDSGNGDIATAIRAIQYAIRNGARIINASWGNTDRSSALADAVDEAYQAGVLFIAAAGNNNSDTPFYPAAYRHAVGVAATDQKDHRARFSDFGSYVEVAAPGENIYSTIPNNSYDFYSGTSMAAPHVSGVAALVLSRHPEFAIDQVQNILRDSVDVITPDKYLGTGRINAAAAARVNAPLPQVKLNLPGFIDGEVNIEGVATGDGFLGYSLEYGRGTNPTNWTTFFTSTTAVASGTLFQSFSTPQLGEGSYTFRLTARNAAGEQAVERASVQVSNVHISSPTHNDVLRAGGNFDIVGTVFGNDRTYTLEFGTGSQPAAWFKTGISLRNGGTSAVREGVLATWDTSLVASNQFYTLKLTANSPDGTSTEFLTRLIYLDSHLRLGWPQYIPIVGDYPGQDWRNVVVADLDQDGKDEIILVDHGNNGGKPARLLVYRFDGTLMWCQELASGYPYSDIPVVGDIDGDGFPEVFVDVGSEGQLFAFHHDGSPLAGKWPVHLEATSLGKALADLNADGQMELIGFSNDTVTHGDSDYRQLVVFDKEGNLIRRWEIDACDVEADAPKLLPAVGDLDGDPDLEIVVVTGCDSLSAFKVSSGTGPIWSRPAPATFVTSPIIADLNHDGTNEVLIASYDLNGHKRGGLYVLDNTGKNLPGWPVLQEESFLSTPAVGDLDGDGQLEISIPCSRSGLLHLLRRDGFEVEGWPVGPIANSSLKCNPVIGDLDGDGRPDIVMSSPGYMSLVVSSGDFSQAGGVKAWSFDGQPIPLNGAGGLLPLIMECSVGAWSKAPPVTLADVDHDGQLDAVAVSLQDRTYLPLPEKSNRKNRSSLYVWNLAVPYLPEKLPWPTFQGNPQHTGSLSAPKHVNQPPVVAAIPNQIIPPGAAFFPVELDQYVDDPDNSPRQMIWTASGALSLQVTVGTNRVARVQAPSADWLGQETIRFIAQDPGGLVAGMDVTFEVRSGYVPPAASLDWAVTPEDIPVEIDVLANDSDPANRPLTVASFSKPLRGKVTRTSQGRLLYTPKLYARGLDSFSYVLSNGQGGMSQASVTVEITPVNHPPLVDPAHAITDEDNSVDIDLLATASDPDEDSLVLIDFSSPENGSLERIAGGVLRYMPKPFYYGMDTFNYSVADSHGVTNTGTASIMVKFVNHPPVAQSQSFTLNRNSSANITYAATDPDSRELTYTIVDSPMHGSLWNYPKVATYYPTNGFSGTDSFTYRASDGYEDGPLATVHFTVLDVNNPPDVQDHSIVTKVDQSVAIHLAATDLDEDPLTFDILSSPARGLLSGSGTNYLYRPDAGFLGNDRITFQASDGKDSSRVASIEITVTDQNTAPVAQDFSVQVPPNTPTNITLRADDIEANPLNFHIVTRPLTGKLTGKGVVLTYSPGANFAGSDRFTFKVDDGELESNVATVSLNVEPANHAPVTTNQQVIVVRNTSTAIQLAVQDQDSDALNCPILKGPKHGWISGLSTNFIYNPKTGFVGSDSFTYKVWDGHTYSHEATVSIKVVPVAEDAQLGFESVAWLPGGQVQLILKTPNDQPVQVLASTNLVEWTPLPSGSAPGNGKMTFVDLDASKFAQRFYRAQLGP